MNEGNYMRNAERSTKQNYNHINGIIRQSAAGSGHARAGNEAAGQGEKPAAAQIEPGAGGAVSKRKRTRAIPLYVRVSQEEYDLIRERMAEAGTRNMAAYIRKLTLNGFILHVDLSPVRELVSLQRRCANNINQVAIHANTSGLYQRDIAGLKSDYAALWEPLSDLLKQLAAIVAI